MTIKAGEQLPSGSLTVMGPEGPKPVTTGELFDGNKVVMFAVPGAFTPGCSRTHLPGFVVSADDILARGVDRIICVAVNDVFVMDAWGKAQNADQIIMAADGNGDYTRALGLELDATGFGMGKRSRRYAMVVDNGKVTYLGVDERDIDKSSAATVLNNL